VPHPARQQLETDAAADHDESGVGGEEGEVEKKMMKKKKRRKDGNEKDKENGEKEKGGCRIEDE
jgi:hypothetical protein